MYHHIGSHENLLQLQVYKATENRVINWLTDFKNEHFSKGFSHHTLQQLLFFRRGRHSETSFKILHFNFPWLVCQCYPWICVLFSRVSKHSHGCHSEKGKKLILTHAKTNINPFAYSSLSSVRHHLSEFILSVTTGCASFFSRSHMCRFEAASSTQKTVGLVWAHCSETTGSPAVLFSHCATGCSWLTACNLMLPFPPPTWNKDRENSENTLQRIQSKNLGKS